MTSDINIFSVESLPGMDVSVAFIPTNITFREDKDITPVPIGDSGIQYIPWGANNHLPYDILDIFEHDETLSVCSSFQSEACYAAGLRYIPDPDNPQTLSLNHQPIKEFLLDNDIPSYYLGTCKDIKMYEFAVSVLILSEDGTRITNIYRKEVAYCRFAPAMPDGHIPYILYASWRQPVTSVSQLEQIPVIDNRRMRAHLRELAALGLRKLAVITRIPAIDSMYYPIPVYASIFKSRWYNIKKYIAIAKEAKLKNSAPIKYLIEISDRYWQALFNAEHIVDPVKKQERVNKMKQEMIDFLTGAKNSGKAIFSNYYTSPDGKEAHDIRISKIESGSEGGDWESDHNEAINMLCFAMRVHSNLVGSVPGKSQSNNSGSDKRELYTIAQAMQKPYRDCLLRLHRLIIDYNGWYGWIPECPIIQLTTLDQHTDAKEATTND